MKSGCPSSGSKGCKNRPMRNPATSSIVRKGPRCWTARRACCQRSNRRRSRVASGRSSQRSQARLPCKTVGMSGRWGGVPLDSWTGFPAVPAERIQVSHSQRCQEPPLEPNACRPSRVHGLRVGRASGPPGTGRGRVLEGARLSAEPSCTRGETLEEPKQPFGEGRPWGGTAESRKRNQRWTGARRRATRRSS